MTFFRNSRFAAVILCLKTPLFSDRIQKIWRCITLVFPLAMPMIVTPPKLFQAIKNTNYYKFFLTEKVIACKRFVKSGKEVFRLVGLPLAINGLFFELYCT